jgi:hypothetical protein
MMVPMKCGLCLNFPKQELKGKLKTSNACENWNPNWEALPKKLYESYVLISKLKAQSMILFSQFWNSERVEDLVFGRPHSCKNCVHFKSCGFEPKEDSKPLDFQCYEWSFDLANHTDEAVCQPELRDLMAIVKTLLANEKPLITYFLHRQTNINKIKPIPVFIEDEVEFRVFDKHWFKGKVVRLTEEHVIVSNGKATMSLLYATLQSSENVKKPYKKEHDELR